MNHYFQLKVLEAIIKDDTISEEERLMLTIQLAIIGSVGVRAGIMPRLLAYIEEVED